MVVHICEDVGGGPGGKEQPETHNSRSTHHWVVRMRKIKVQTGFGMFGKEYKVTRGDLTLSIETLDGTIGLTQRQKSAES